MTETLTRYEQSVRLVFDLPTDADTAEFQTELSTKIRQAVEDVAEVWFSGMPQAKGTSYRNVCRVCHQSFAHTKDVDICRMCWYAEAIKEAEAEHEPLFAPLREGSNQELVGHIHQSGGMTMTIVIPTKKGAYLALQEGGADGIWNGSVSYHLRQDDVDFDGVGVNDNRYSCYAYLESPERDIIGYDAGLTPAQWAEKILADWKEHDGRTGAFVVWDLQHGPIGPFETAELAEAFITEADTKVPGVRDLDLTSWEMVEPTTAQAAIQLIKEGPHHA